MNSNKNYINLARKYRPKNLADVVGQDVLVTTLSNAIKTRRLSSSYLLCGTRGIGKTTTARIIAKSLNCTNLIEGILTCEECVNCASFNKASHPDILEMDAASRTGVDDIRSIIENTEYKPMLGSTKVFILDEVHMLSKNAFNALLKVLEEPPMHCVFIFATTEVHKIPLTIVSRCQRFDLPRIDVLTLIDLLKNICSKEGVTAEDKALEMICFKGDGSARDSLALLDQAIIMSTDNKITTNIVEVMLSIVDYKIILDFIDDILIRDADSSIGILKKFYQTHSDFHLFISNILSILCYIAKKNVCTNYTSTEFHSIESRAEDIAKKIEPFVIQILWKLAYSSMQELKISDNQLLNMEMLALKMIYVLSTVVPEDTGLNTEKKTLKTEVSTAHQGSTANIAPVHNSEMQQNRDAQGVSDSQYVDIPPPTPKTDQTGNKCKEFTRLDFDQFLKHLSEIKEMELLYELFSKSELISINRNELMIAQTKQNKGFEKSISEMLTKWFGSKINCNFIYKNDILTYKNKILKEIEEMPIIKRISKNFPDIKMIDIILTNEE